MTVYVIAQLTFKNRERYDAYQARFAPVFAQSGGRLLSADEAPRLLQGDWMGDKVVIMAFDDEPSAMRFLNSDAYQDISVDRDAGADTVALLVSGPGV